MLPNFKAVKQKLNDRRVNPNNVGSLDDFRYAYIIGKIGILGAVADLFIKALLKNSHETRELLPNILTITSHKNYGLIANVSAPKELIIVFTFIALLIVIKSLITAWKQKSELSIYGLSYILAGALGNLVDRLVHGYVYDWILLFNTSVINLADIMITAGIIIYIYSQMKSGTLAENKKQTGDC